MSNLSNLMLDAMTRKPKGIRTAWAMYRASYAYSRCHGLGVWESFVGAVQCGWRWF